MNYWKYGLCAITIILVPSCGGPRNMSFFPSTETEKAFLEMTQDLEISVQKFSSQDAKDYFGADLPALGYVPLHLHVYNKSDDMYVLRAGDIELPLVSCRRIAELLYYNTSSFATWTSIPAALFYWPALSVIIPTACGMSWYNASVDKDLNEKGFKKSEVLKILPHEVVDKFIFVPADELPNCFALNFTNKKTKWVTTLDVSFEEASKEA
jgi:hypothetical protein